jgi:hypothetical protein
MDSASQYTSLRWERVGTWSDTESKTMSQLQFRPKTGNYMPKPGLAIYLRRGVTKRSLLHFEQVYDGQKGASLQGRLLQSC